ncbi:glycoside hydrolase family 5 protein [Streptomyces sp. SYSU K21746]
MKNWTVRAVLVIAVAFGLLAAAHPANGGAAGGTVKARTPVEKYGKVRVCGVHLCAASGRPVQLRGMSTHGTQWYPQCVTDAALDAIAYDWKASVLRVATYAREGGYASNPAKFTRLANELIDRASSRGMYVVVDWHMLHPGDPNIDIDNAMTFFKAIAKRHKNKPNVLYEIANEPNRVSWPRIRTYAEKLIPVIRAEDPDSVILVGTRGWSTLGKAVGSSEQEILDAPVRASNIMYTFHYYAAWNRDSFRNALDRASGRLPVFVTEWGTPSYTGIGNDFPMAQKFVDLMARKKISWTNWALADNDKELSVFKKGACGRGEFAGTGVLKPAGVWVRERIRG